MQLIVQEGRAIVSLTVPVRAHDEVLRTTSFNELTEDVKVFYRDFEIVRVELRGGAIEVLPPAIGGIYWLEKGKRYQLKIAAD